MKFNLHIGDYIMFVGTIVGSLAIGLWVGVRGHTSGTKENYFVGNRKMRSLPVAISLLVTYESSIMMLGTPAEVYIYGPSILISGVAFFVADLLCAYVTVPLFRPLMITSAFEYLRVRFKSTPVSFVGIALYSISNLFYMGIILFGPGVALEAVTGLSRWVLIFGLATSAVIYTSLGGIVSVVWTDVFQALVMIGGIVAVIIKGTIDVGGFGNVWKLAKEGQRLDVFNFDPDPTVRHTVWTLFLPTILRSLQTMFNQSTVQRVAATSSDKAAKRVLIGSAFMALVLYLLVVWEGIVIFSYFASQGIAEPITCGLISNPNQIVPYSVLRLFHNLPGMPGLFLAALVSASLSTLSSSLSSMTMVIVQDIVCPFWGELSETKSMILAKVTVVSLGFLASLVAVVVSLMSGSLNQIASSLIYSTAGAFAGVFMLGCFFPSSVSKGALLGAFVGSLLGCTFTIGKNFSPGVKKTPWLPLGGSGFCNNTPYYADVTSQAAQLFNTTSALNSTGSGVQESLAPHSFNVFDLSYNLTAAIGVTFTVLSGILASYILGRNRPGDVNSLYFLEISESLFIWLPAPLRRRLKAIGPQFKAAWREGINKHLYGPDTCTEKSNDQINDLLPSSERPVKLLEKSDHINMTGNGHGINS